MKLYTDKEMDNKQINIRIKKLTAAFSIDGYEVKRVLVLKGRIGITAQHGTARNYDTKCRKKIYYVEGTPYQMGYMLGLMAEQEIADMAVHFTDDIVFEFIGKETLKKHATLKRLLVYIIYKLARKAYQDLPCEIRCEMNGILDGCRKSNPGTAVSMMRLIVLNMGIDVLCSLAYTGQIPLKNMVLKAADIRLPIACNAFSIFGPEAGGGHYFGRDFMFPTAGVLQDTACHIIYNPETKRKKSLPFVCTTAPGLVGSIAAMNIHGVAAGVDMSPAANCDPEKVGVNSLLLTRLCIQYGRDAEEAVRYIVHAERGVSWNYVISDGSTDRACCVEAGASTKRRDYLCYPPEWAKPLLPDKDFIASHRSAAFQNGVMVRWNDYKYPSGYLRFNDRLWSAYREMHDRNIRRFPGAFDATGFINKTFKQKNCPSGYYFAPMREKNDHLVITTNHFIIPEMRLYAMHPWTAAFIENLADDIQWRYDELNWQIHKTLDARGAIDYETAKRLVDLLAPYGSFPNYYAHNPKSEDGKETRINGITSIFDLKKKAVESHFGYYCDDWVKVTLPRYFES